MEYLSQTENKALMAQARAVLTGKWGIAIGVCLVYMLVVYAVQIVPGIGWIASLVISGPLTLGLSIFALALSREQDHDFSQLFEGFQYFGNALGAYLLMILFILLWMLLLVVPGIIAALSYSQLFFIMADDKNIAPMDALAKSKQMMQGSKWKFFCLNCRFIGWALLCVLTMGIGYLWLAPYMMISFARFYDDLKPIGAVEDGNVVNE